MYGFLIMHKQPLYIQQKNNPVYRTTKQHEEDIVWWEKWKNIKKRREENCRMRNKEWQEWMEGRERERGKKGEMVEKNDSRLVKNSQVIYLKQERKRERERMRDTLLYIISIWKANKSINRISNMLAYLCAFPFASVSFCVFVSRFDAMLFSIHQTFLPQQFYKYSILFDIGNENPHSNCIIRDEMYLALLFLYHFFSIPFPRNCSLCFVIGSVPMCLHLLLFQSFYKITCSFYVYIYCVYVCVHTSIVVRYTKRKYIKPFQLVHYFDA